MGRLARDGHGRVSGFVALLRGINVGGHRRVPMPRLREILEAEGLERVRTYVQSGNVVFDAPTGDAASHTATVARVIELEFGFSVDTLVLSCEAVRAIAAENPFVDEDPAVDEGWLHVAFPLDPIDAGEFAAHSLAADEGERALFGRGAVYLMLPHGVGRSKLAAAIGRAMWLPNTARNWRTVLALQSLVDERR